MTRFLCTCTTEAASGSQEAPEAEDISEVGRAAEADCAEKAICTVLLSTEFAQEVLHSTDI